ncbi:MAG: carboxypeptidase regulatory-like domain-containing protein [wastewater metagenome]|nr:carboxypeptidase regulatory-like domain-containing protein [Candidatus Loosdrechtia aerotolerans]
MRTGMVCRLPILFVVLVTSTLANCTLHHNVAVETSEAMKSSEKGILTGKVMRGPIFPVKSKDMPPDSKPAPGIRLVISTPDGQQVGSVITDDQGIYSIALPPGTYCIETTSLSGIEFTKNLPALVTVTEGKKTHLEVYIDTGIR